MYGIVTQARGHVRVYSEPGIGTTFTILLPATGHDSVRARAPAPASATGRRHGRDHPGGRGRARDAGGDPQDPLPGGYQVITAANGREAIQVATTMTAAASTYWSPTSSCRNARQEAAERIRALRPGVKVLFMSGYTRGLLDSKGIAAGAST